MALPKVNVAKYEMVIPSTGQAVKYRPYLVAEEKILMIAMESGDQKQILSAISDVIEACVEGDIKASNLAMFDIETIFLNLRSKSVGESVDINIECQKEGCNETIQQHINVEDIKLPEVDESRRIVQLTPDIGITLKYPAFEDVTSLDPEDMENIEGLMKLVKNCLDTIFTEDEVYEASSHSDKELDEFLGNLSSDQFLKINEFFTSMPSLVYNLKFDCGKCNGANEIELRGIQSFFT